MSNQSNGHKHRILNLLFRLGLSLSPVLGIEALAKPPAIHKYAQELSIDSLLSSLKNMPKTSSVEYYGPDDPDTYFFHIKMSHRRPEVNTRREFAEINAVQKNIYDILVYLLDNSMIDHVRVEGSFLRPDENQDDLTQKIKDIYKKELERVSPFGDYPYYPGAAEKLVFEGKVKPRPFMSYSDHRKRKGDKDKGITKVDYDEDALLSMVCGNLASFSGVPMGGSHSFYGVSDSDILYASDILSWRNNIDSWNDTHPDKKVGVFIVTPMDFIQERIRLPGGKKVLPHYLRRFDPNIDSGSYVNRDYRLRNITQR